MSIGADPHLKRRRIGTGQPTMRQQLLGPPPRRRVQPNCRIHDRLSRRGRTTRQLVTHLTGRHLHDQRERTRLGIEHHMTTPRMRNLDQRRKIRVKAGFELIGAVHRRRLTTRLLHRRDLRHQSARQLRIVNIPGQLEQQAERHLTSADPCRLNRGHASTVDGEHPSEVLGIQLLDGRRQPRGHEAPYPEVDIPSLVRTL